MKRTLFVVGVLVLSAFAMAFPKAPEREVEGNRVSSGDHAISVAA